MAVCDPEEGMHALFAGLLPQHHVIDLPRDEASIAAFDAFLERHADELAGILVEPLVQGAGGMLFHDDDVLRRLRAAADKYDLLLIFDEIFTGFGRTGAMFACEAAGVAPDIITLGKGLTGGTLPLAATVATRKVFDAFWSDDPVARADARPDLHGQCAGLRRRQRLARSVRARSRVCAGRGDMRPSWPRPAWPLPRHARCARTSACAAPSASSNWTASPI